MITNPNATPAFFFDVEPFDVPSGYRGVDGRPVGHFNIWALPVSAAPASCWHGVRLGDRAFRGLNVTIYDCPDASSVQAEREITHGEGLFSDHLLYEWRTSQAAYFVSVHGGNTEPNRAMLDRIMDSLRFVDA